MKRAGEVSGLSVALWLMVLSAVPAQAQGGRAVALEEALRLASEQSEQITVARAAVLRAEGQQMQARSERLPQVGASLGYTRTLASEFEGAFSGGGGADSTAGPPPGPPCERFFPDPSLPLDQRIAQLEAQHSCDSSPFAGLDFSDLPFGRENIYRLGLSVSQNLFAGGRIAAQTRIARTGLETAQIGLRQAESVLALEVTQAYYDAVLTDRLLAIAEATLEQAEGTLRQVALAREVGTQPEFELLRAQVTRDNQRPVAIQRRAERDLAYLRLKQLLNLPAGEPIQLTSDLGDGDLAPAAQLVAGAAGAEPGAPDTTALRAVVDQARQAVEVQEALLDVASSQRLPSLMVTSQYGRVAYPASGLPTWGDSRPNWTVGLTLAVPIFTGGRIRGDQRVAEANLLEARARLQQVRELASLDTRGAYEELRAALAAYQASNGTVGQAQRAYQIAEVRYREGISTQLELSDSRILLQQAQANRALTARNLQIARSRIALLPYLPLGAGSTLGGAPQGGAQTQPQQPQPPARQPQQRAMPPQGADASQNAFTGAGGI